METACGAGIEVTEEEIKDAVNALIEKNKEALMTQRYCFPISQLMYAMKEGRMKWADGKKMREIFDAAILALLGPKTAADTEEAQDPDTEPAEPDTPAAEAADTAPEETAPGDPAEEPPAEAPAQDEDGRIDLNTATAADLETLPGVGPVLAARILDYRAAYGPFRAVEELLNVSGIGEKKLEAIRSLVTVR